ncbi:Phosphoribosylformylglycinamidine cyclo-ligase [Moorella thermoacetica]|uniref:Phosphoribosylformylglycinamidine cyclo-ligase n=1 Tax=Neomoorella thermoacetica TaxID=1525 RepID=A0A1J5JPX7_NEOTH|nr:phosphoribosylformylglycinamidine cyclo-ligase [Moorella thermoacetica]OIQ08930.1 phosphoribosylformylglycinamidine cyclo-ligase [Moorella thermoacetica]OIQ11157.1 phosphoribosylformylglycinamidine cyclo-ligase [Moorella thermoacetica]
MVAGEGFTYAAAGVDIAAGNRAVELMKEHVRRTFRPGVLGDLGGFGGLFALEAGRYRQPVLVAGTDGVGTKLKIAFSLDRHDTIGIDAVAMCVNDILVQGAEPLFFLDYLAVGKMVPERVARIVAGVAEGCRRAGCALIGGETAEMPGFYREDEYDLAGFAVGVVEREELLDGSRIRPGQVVLGLASSGLHSNGFSLVRRVLLVEAGYTLERKLPELGRTLGEELLEPTRIYVASILPLLKEGLIKGLAHITGGGLIENPPRILPPGCSLRLDRRSWPVPPAFRLIQATGRVPEEEMYRTFNMGLGMLVVVEESDAGRVKSRLEAAGEKVFVVGEVIPGRREVEFVPGLQ